MMTKRRRFISVPTAIIGLIVVFLIGFGVKASGFLILNSDDRYFHQRYQIYRLKKFFHLSERDNPLFHKFVGQIYGNDNWNRKFCYSAFQERQRYEEQMTRKTFLLKHREPVRTDIDPLWEKLNLRPYSRFWITDQSKVHFVVRENEVEKVERLLQAYDR